ncbi:PAS domain S-box protein [Emticicia sp. BO119]|uniref:PAS domain S-box protein n=1 Tax=Emticicia sp. BO119 TaxID=2757768 RepID=UPI0015F123E8|nr:PAS domain S-box protein [Emticicia sp. BO119]MBA4851150.1 PAS domain S-box protein [Emticicia sp. BO119]
MTDLLPVPVNEKERLQALQNYNLLDSIDEEEFDRLTRLASIICGVPMSVISLVDEERQWFKSNIGIEDKETDRSISFCQYTIMDTTIFAVEDATQDERFKNNPLVKGNPNIRFYAGYPLIDPDGYALGSMCVMDNKPRKLTREQEEALMIIAQEVVSQIIARKEKEELKEYETLFNLSKDLICIAGDGHFKKINPAFEQTLGWTNDQLAERPVIEFIHNEDKGITEQQITNLYNHTKTINFNNRFRTVDGDYKLLQWVVTTHPDTGNAYGVGRDITEQNRIEKELVETKNMLESTNQVAKIGAWKVNLDTQEISFSDITKEIYEVDPDYVPTVENNILFNNDNKEVIEAMIRKAIENSSSFDTEFQVVTARGNKKWIRAVGKAELSKGKPSILYGTLQDIDKEKLVRIELDKVNTELKAILDADSGILIITTNEFGYITTYNKGAELMLGYTAKEMIGIKKPYFFHDPDEVEAYAQKVTKELGIQLRAVDESLIAKARLGKTDTNEWTFITKDGNRITVELSITPLTNNEKEIIGFVGIAKDITAKKIWERKIMLSEERHRGFFEHSQGLMCTHDLKGKFLTVNPAGAQLLGYSAEEYLQKTLFDLVPAEYADVVKLYLNQIKEHGQFKGLMKVQHRDGSFRTWMYNNILSELIDGEKYVIGNAVDMTEHIMIEKELIKAKVQAEQNAHAKDVFLANMSHEIRTPMNAIVGFANLLKDTYLNEEQTEYLSYIITSTENLLGIINDILDISKIESGHIVIEEVPFSVKEIVRTVRNILKNKAHEKGLELDCSVDENIPEILLGDPTRLNQILLNLANNAVKFTTSGSVKMVVEQLSNTVAETTISFKVIDTGIGIPQEKLDMIFDRFTQANSDTTRKYGGTGLGLSISKSLVELQNGELWVESVPDQGSIFAFKLIYKKVKDESDKNKSGNSALLVSDKKVHVLLVEDNILNQKLALRVLEKFGFTSDLAQNGRIAVEKVRDNKYDIILMDLQMPEMDGYQATTTIRQELKDTTPIMAMTAHSLVGEKDKCIEIGMNEYITKPFNQRELFDKIMSFV